MTMMPARRVARPLGRTIVVFAMGVAALALFLLVGGFRVTTALAALWQGAFGSWYAFTSIALVHAVPLAVLGLAFTLGAQAGLLNIGMEGQFALGATAAAWIGTHAGGWSPPIAVVLVLAGGLLAGAFWIAVPTLLRTRFGTSEVISTLLLNFVATGMVSYAVTGPLQEPSHVYPQSALISVTARLPMLAPRSRLHAGFLLAVLVAGLLAILLRHTRTGFAIRAVGEGPVAAAISGRVRVTRITALVLLWSGALAGLGGAIEVSGVSYALYQNLSPGYGFTAIAVALLGRLEPVLVLVAAVLFGALEAGAGAMQRDAAIPAVAVQVVEAVVIITMLLGQRSRSWST